MVTQRTNPMPELSHCSIAPGLNLGDQYQRLKKTTSSCGPFWNDQKQPSRESLLGQADLSCHKSHHCLRHPCRARWTTPPPRQLRWACQCSLDADKWPCLFAAPMGDMWEKQPHVCNRPQSVNLRERTFWGERHGTLHMLVRQYFFNQCGFINTRPRYNVTSLSLHDWHGNLSGNDAKHECRCSRQSHAL